MGATRRLIDPETKRVMHFRSRRSAELAMADHIAASQNPDVTYVVEHTSAYDWVIRGTPERGSVK